VGNGEPCHDITIAIYISLPKSGKDVSEIFLGMEKAYVQTRLVRKGRIYSALGKWKRRIYIKD